MSDNTIIFQALDWKDFNESVDYNDDIDEDNPNAYQDKYIIRLFGRTLDDKSVHVKILDYTPHFYIELPPNFATRHIEMLVDTLKNKNSFYDSDPCHSHVSLVQ
jgi:hypothetical protein